MDFKKLTKNSLQLHGAKLAEKQVLCGLDGFVDTIVTPVDLRRGQGEDFTPIETIEAFGKRILAAAGKSTNIEFYPLMDKLGGNGPIMANANMAAGTRLTYIGALGKTSLNPVFEDFASKATIVSLADPAHTTAVEFNDGKLMLGKMRSFSEITFERILEVMTEKALLATVANADLISLVNWTMIPHMTDIFVKLVEQILPKVPKKDRIFFFDLADPEKRSYGDIVGALNAIADFEQFGKVTLGLNLKEAQRIYSVLGYKEVPVNEEVLREMASIIREKLKLSTVIVHPKESAACASSEGTEWIPGPYTSKPLITTGAGDHFNAGFTNAQLLGLSPIECLTTGVCTSGHYVRTGKSPTIEDICNLIDSWK